MSKASSRNGFAAANRCNSPRAERQRPRRWRSTSRGDGGCIATAAAITRATGVTAKTCEDLNDIDYGAWQFKTFAEAKTQDATLFAAWFAKPQLVRFPKGESLQDLAARTANALLMVLARHRDEIVVLVGHDSVNR